ncbi:MAG: GTPase HflX [Oligoflexales bacterium]
MSDEQSLILFGSEPLKAVVVGVADEKDEEFLEWDLAELKALLRTLGIEPVIEVVQNRKRLTSRSFLGTGKIQEVAQLARDNGACLLAVDHRLTGIQVRHLEDESGCQVVDRAGVILEIFARHAKSRQARIQVEIARQEYLISRLSGAWTHFQRQKGGGVRSRGMGEKQIDVDRKLVRDRLSRLNRKLEQIRKERETQSRGRRNELRVGLVGYTNSGKTSLMSSLTRTESEGKDELFATLDASTRMIDPNTRPRILLSDTVGFIRRLPHALVDSFRSTLEEVVHANLLLHVVDLSHPNYQAQIEVTKQVLEEVGAGDIPTLLVFNKRDQVEDPFLARIVSRAHSDSIVVSAHDRNDVLKLRERVFSFFEDHFEQLTIAIPADHRTALSLIYGNCVVLDADYETPGEVQFVLRAPPRVLQQIKHYAVESSDDSL